MKEITVDQWFGYVGIYIFYFKVRSQSKFATGKYFLQI